MRLSLSKILREKAKKLIKGSPAPTAALSPLFLKHYAANAKKSLPEIEKEISKKYRKYFGRELHWENPQTYTEKIQVAKVYGASELKTKLSDKISVRDWVKERIGEEYLVPLFGIYKSFDEIPFDSLPGKFVIKCNHDSGSTTVCEDKNKLNRYFLKRCYDNFYLKRNYAFGGYEMHYKNIQPQIIVEKNMGNAINDYKFLCFDGQPRFCWVDFNRFTNHKRNIYDLQWKLQPFNQYHYGNYEKDVPCPDEYERMKGIASTLCKGFDHVRVDLYLIKGKIYFGEMTFSNGSGFEEIIPDEWDYKLGELWSFDNNIRSKIRDGNGKVRRQ